MPKINHLNTFIQTEYADPLKYGVRIIVHMYGNAIIKNPVDKSDRIFSCERMNGLFCLLYILRFFGLLPEFCTKVFERVGTFFERFGIDLFLCG